jgi:hypothetical protein
MITSLVDDGNRPGARVHRRTRRVIPMILAAFHCSAVIAQAPGTIPVVRQVDHIMIRTGNPQTLFALFAEEFALPLAWPLADRKGVMSGGVSFGNVNVEAIRFAAQASGKPSLVGFAFEPASSLSASLTELDSRGIGYGQLRPFVVTAPGGSTRTLWTNVTLAQLSDSDTPAAAKMHIFLSEYTRDYVDTEQRRQRLCTALVESDGGPLGVRGVVEVTVGTTNPAVATELWGKLLAPHAPSKKGVWRVGSGPSIRVIRAEEDAVVGLVVGVASLERAKAFLREKALLGSVSRGQVTIAPDKVEGINITLIEPAPDARRMASSCSSH